MVVVAAAGNAGDRAFAAHASPWVTTVGGTTGAARRGEVRLRRPRVADRRDGRDPRHRPGARRPGRATSPRPAHEPVAGPGLRAGQPRRRPRRRRDRRLRRGAASAGSTSPRPCRRPTASAWSSSTPAAAPVAADFHSVPTVHLDRADGAALRRWLADHPHGRAALRPIGVERSPARLTSWSASGDPAAGVLKPDVVAPGVGVLGAVPPLGERDPLGLRLRHVRGDGVHQRRRGPAAARGTTGRPAWCAPRWRRPPPRSGPRARSCARAPAGCGPATRTRRGWRTSSRPATTAPGWPAGSRTSASTPRRCCSTTTRRRRPGRSRTSAAGRCTSPRPPAASPGTTCRRGGVHRHAEHVGHGRRAHVRGRHARGAGERRRRRAGVGAARGKRKREAIVASLAGKDGLFAAERYVPTAVPTPSSPRTTALPSGTTRPSTRCSRTRRSARRSPSRRPRSPSRSRTRSSTSRRRRRSRTRSPSPSSSR